MEKKNIFLMGMILCLAMILATMPLSPGYAKSKDKNVIKIGALVPLTGDSAMWGKGFKNSMELALDETGWKVAGKKIEFIVEDEGAQDVSLCLEKAKKLVEADQVDIMMGPFFGGSAFTVLPYTSSIPIVNVKWSEPNKSKDELGNKYAFWVPMTYSDNTYPLGIYAYEEKGIRTVSTIGSDFSVGYDFMGGFTDAFKSKGGKVIQQQWAPLIEADYSPFLSNLKEADAWVVSCLGPRSKMPLFAQYDELGLFKKMPVYISEPAPLSPAVLQQMGDKIIGVKSIAKFLKDQNPEAEKFFKSYVAKYKGEPDEKACDAYNGMMVVLEALKNNGGNTDPDNLKKALLGVKMNLPSGPFQFSEGRIGMQYARVVEVQKVGGKLDWVSIKEYPQVKPHIKTYP
jgi:branched-chain amino acid transport system substrate-binding protein